MQARAPRLVIRSRDGLGRTCSWRRPRSPPSFRESSRGAGKLAVRLGVDRGALGNRVNAGAVAERAVPARAAEAVPAPRGTGTWALRLGGFVTGAAMAHDENGPLVLAEHLINVAP
jgi:hypothetical protein